MHRLYSISVNWGPSPNEITPAIVPDIFPKPTDDWVQFSGMQWFVWTDATLSELVANARTVLAGHPAVNYIISRVEPVAANGISSAWVWQWLNEKMNLQREAEFIGN